MADAPQAGSRPLRLVLAGVGTWGKSWVDVAVASPFWQLAALVDLDGAALERASRASGIPSDRCFPTVAAAAAATEADAALVVVPPAAHGAVALEALDAGLHVLVEKPFASNVTDARAIVERGARAGRLVMVSQQYRHRAGARTVQRLVSDGAIGRVGLVSIRFAQTLPTQGFQHEMEEPLLLDMAIHHFDLVRGVVGVEPERVVATSHNPHWSRFAGNATATAVLEAGDGTTVAYEGNWAPNGPLTGWDGVWEIQGDEGSILWDGGAVLVRGHEPPTSAKVQRRLLRREWRGRRVAPASVEHPDRSGSLAEFAAAIREGREAETSGRDNLRSLAVTLAAVESARRRAAVDVGELLAG